MTETSALPPRPSARQRYASPALLLAVLALALGGWQWYDSRRELRAVKRITMRTPSTSNCRIEAIHRLSASRLRVSTASSRQPSNQP